MNERSTAWSTVGPPHLCRVIVWEERGDHLAHVGGPAADFLCEPISIERRSFRILPPRR